ncbi:hypothetical protein Hanom_Chr04g00374801 [Helianthus anomalus]
MIILINPKNHHQNPLCINNPKIHHQNSKFTIKTHQKFMLTTTPRMEILSTQHDSPANSSSSDGCSTTTNKPTQTPPRPV